MKVYTIVCCRILQALSSPADTLGVLPSKLIPLNFQVVLLHTVILAVAGTPSILLFADLFSINLT